jgi:acyl-CoA thioester hydrolase
LIARVRSKGGWLDLNARKLVAPPSKLLTAMRRAPRSEDFQEVPSSLKEGTS